MTSKAEKSPTTTRRQVLAASPAVLVASSVPAMAGSSISPELAVLIANWKAARAEFLRLVEIDRAATALHHSSAPEIPKCIVAWKNQYADGIDRFPKEYEGHLRYASRPGDDLSHTLRPSWWLKELAKPKPWPSRERIAENLRIAEEFEAADEASYAAAGCEAATLSMEAAADFVNELESDIEDFEARSWADVAAMARVFEVIVSDGQIHEETWQSLLDNVKRVSAMLGV